ncbi:MAG: glycosyltransferase family 4 protein [bacterium]
MTRVIFLSSISLPSTLANRQYVMSMCEGLAQSAAVGLSHDGKIVMYVGHFYGWKGVDTLVRSATRLGPRVAVFLVGGKAGDVESIRDLIASVGATNVHLMPFQPPGRIPQFLKAADVLVLPNTSGSENSVYYTSPLKLFQYMAAGKPIVASDLPSLRQVLGPENALLVRPDDPEALAQGIQRVLNEHEEAARRAKLAQEQVREHTWEKRARRVLEFASTGPLTRAPSAV